MKKLDVVGFGPGSKEKMTLEAYDVISKCDVVVGFTTYVNIIKDFFPDKEYVSTGMGKEVDRTKEALEIANTGRHVALVCSGDSSVYGMAGLAYELAVSYPEVCINTIPGVTAALSGGALLGAAIGNDMCTISLSDYHTSWEDIVKRVSAVAENDFVIALYNPCSKKRPQGLKNICTILLEILPGDRVCGLARNIGRTDESYEVVLLEQLAETECDMFTTVFIGNSKTRIINGHMVTPRGYKID